MKASPYHCEGPVQESINLERKSVRGGGGGGRGGIWKGDMKVADLEELETTDVEICSKRLHAKVIFPKETGEFFFQSQMDESKPLMSGNFICRHHVEPREEPFPIPLKYIDVSMSSKRNASMIKEYRWVWRLVKPPDGFLWSRGE